MRRVVGAACAALAALAVSGCGGEDPVPDLFDAPAPGVLVRPDTPNGGLQFHFDAGEVVESLPSPGGSFLVHFTRSGRNAVPAADADQSGVPDFVEQVAALYDDVLAYYKAQKFRAPRSDEGLPDNGGDGRFDVYLVDFAGIGDGNYQNDTCDPADPSRCSGYMIQENDFKGYGYPSITVANRILASHELFHAVQAAYDRDQGSIFNEGTAVWATESFDPSLHDFEGFLDGYLENTSRSLDVPLPGPVDPFSYGSAIFFEFLEERYGAGTVRGLLERCEDGAFGVANPVWFEALDPAIAAAGGASFAEAFVEFSTWNLFTASHADPARSYDAGDGYPPVRLTEVTAPHSEVPRFFHASARYYRLAPEGRKTMTAALLAPPDAPTETDGLTMLFAVERGGQYEPVTGVKDVAAAAEVADVDGADSLVVIVVNGAQAGDSKRPTLCIGTPDEVEACRKAAAPSDPPPSVNPVKETGGCACTTTTAPASPSLGPLLGAALLAYRRARRRRSVKAAKASA
jgi:MYXO-CTERM domain-containing protein